MKSICVAVALLLLLATVFSATGYVLKSAAEEVSDSIIKMVDGKIINDIRKFFDSSAVYKLPDSVKDTDDISVIIRVKEHSLLDAYEAGDRAMSFGEYVYTDEASFVTQQILDEKDSILASLEGKNINYDLGVDYKAVFGE